MSSIIDYSVTDKDFPMANVEDTVQILLGSVERNNSTHQFSPSISMVPSILRDLSPKSFNPRLISIGPLHHNDGNVRAFEEQKAKYMHNLLSRLDSRPEETLRACVEKVNASIHRIRACYAGMLPYSDFELVKMMVMDGCFILEFSHQICENQENLLLFQSINVDLLLVENQIPFFVLYYIFECTILQSKTTASLTDLILPVLEFANIFEGRLILSDIGANTTDDHILGLLLKCYQPKNAIASTLKVPSMHSAVELDRAGVSFKPYQDTNWPLAMELEMSRFACFSWFFVKPTLKMPVLLIFDLSEVYFRNLIAYEQSSLVGKYFTSYAMAMDLLVDSEEDIAKLVESKVLINGIGSNDEAANMMNSICKETAFTGFCYSAQWQQLDSYYNGYWPRNISRLKRRYFNGPWNIIALLAGIVLFALTVVQTIYSIKAV